MKREWTAEVNVDESGQPFYGAVFEAMNDMTTILLRVGGVGGIAPHRVEMEDGSYQVSHVIFKWDSYSPGLHYSRENGQPDEQLTQEQAPVEAQ